MKPKFFSVWIFSFAVLLMFSAFSVALAAKTPPKSTAPVSPPQPFTLEKPAGWTLSQAGECDNLTLFLQNSAEPLQQLFFFPRFGPVYMSQEQKTTDMQYESLSGQTLTRRDMPVVEPLTPENFVRFLPQVLQMKSMRDMATSRPGIRIVETVAVTSRKKALDYLDTQTALLRILFVQDNRLGEGLILVTTVPSPEFRSNPGGGIGMGYLLYGLTAPKGMLTAQLPALLSAGRSFKLSAEYEKKCRKERAEDLPNLLGEGQFLRPVLDSLAAAWEKRLPSEDMAAEKKSDLMRGVERLYLPATGDVYEFSAGFSAEYLKNPARYIIAELRPLPDEPSLWIKQPVEGHKAVILK